MIFSDLVSPQIFNWVVLPLFIFTARIIDVTMGTLRIVFLARGRRSLAPILGFFEVLIWIVAIGQIVQNLKNPISYLAYAAGFAAGNYIGLLLEERLALGHLAVRIITPHGGDDLVRRLHEASFGVTEIPAVGSLGSVAVVFTIIRRRDLPQVVAIIKDMNPKTFFSVEEIRSTSEGVFPLSQPRRTSWQGILKKK